MTLRQLFVSYKKLNINNKKIVLCNWKTQEGFEINSIEEFEKVLPELGNSELYLINQMENEKVIFFEYFIMAKTDPYVVVLRHPLMTNSYWKDLPDKINDVFIADDDGVYRYLTVDYGLKIKEYVIEFPPDIQKDIIDFCSSKMPKGFKKTKNQTSNISLIFTNSSRYKDFDANNFVIYELESIYDDWNIQNITTLNLSRKFFNDIKKVGKE
jgi:hypothetical protein